MNKYILNTNKSYLNSEISVEGNRCSWYNYFVILYILESEGEYVWD